MSTFTIYDHAQFGMDNVNFYAFGLSFNGETLTIIDNSTPGQVTYEVTDNPAVDRFVIAYTDVEGGYIITDVVATREGGLVFEAHDVGQFITDEQIANNELFSNIPLDGQNIFTGNSFADVIDAGGGDDEVYGNGGNDTIFGGDGNDQLFGGAGVDVLSGGLGDDVFVLDSPNDQVSDDGGIDTLAVRYNTAALSDGPSQIEKLFFIGTGNFSGRGNSLNNTIISDVGKDKLSGMGGRDILDAGLGNDTLTGGTGRDVFVFNSKLGTAATDRKVNFDKITDFKVTDDIIWLDRAVFKKLGKDGILNKAYFTIGSQAKDKNDYIVYDSKKGVLYYDADGSGKGQAVEFAQLSKGLKMTYKDFDVL
jgi:Ca2+-binding RTX toxin-like protein